MRPTLFSLQTPIQVEISGHDLRLLTLYSDRVTELLQDMDELTTLDGLDGISSIGKEGGGISITLIGNANLTSATALSNANKGTFTSDALLIVNLKKVFGSGGRWGTKQFTAVARINLGISHDSLFCLLGHNG